MDFLVNKDPDHIQVGYLPFQGRNIVLYRFFDNDVHYNDNDNGVGSITSCIHEVSNRDSFEG